MPAAFFQLIYSSSLLGEKRPDKDLVVKSSDFHTPQARPVEMGVMLINVRFYILTEC